MLTKVWGCIGSARIWVTHQTVETQEHGAREFEKSNSAENNVAIIYKTSTRDNGAVFDK